MEKGLKKKKFDLMCVRRRQLNTYARGTGQCAVKGKKKTRRLQINMGSTESNVKRKRNRWGSNAAMKKGKGERNKGIFSVENKR